MANPVTVTIRGVFYHPPPRRLPPLLTQPDASVQDAAKALQTKTRSSAISMSHTEQFKAKYKEDPTIYKCGVCPWETRYYDSETRHEGQDGHKDSLKAAEITAQRTGQPVPSIGWVSALTGLPTSERAGKSSSGDNIGSASSSSNTMGTTGGSSSTTTTSTAPLSFSAFLHVEAGQPLGSAVLPILAAKLRAKGLTVDAVAEELGVKEELMGKVFRGHICPEKQVLFGVARVLGIAKSILMFSFVGGEGWNDRVDGQDGQWLEGYRSTSSDTASAFIEATRNAPRYGLTRKM